MSKATCTIKVKLVTIEITCNYDEDNHEVEILNSIGNVVQAIDNRVTLEDIEEELLAQLKA